MTAVDFEPLSVAVPLWEEPPGVFRVADSQVASRWGNITEFTDFDMITPNEREARFALARPECGSEARAAS